MVLEATVIILDNSEWMRNGDYTPTRMEAQHDAANLIAGAKTQQNPENTVAVLTGAGKTPDVLVTLTTDLGKVLASLSSFHIEGRLNFSSSVQVAQLVLKHRQNKNQHQRIIMFIGSPIADELSELEKLGKKLKKNNIALDIINFGEEIYNTERLDAFISATSSGNNSHLVTVPAGPHILSDILISSPIITSDGEGGEISSQGGPSSEFGLSVDPNLDPELAMALKVSMEEERARQEAESKTDPQSNQSIQVPPSKTQDVEMADPTEDDDLLAEAIKMSMQQTPTQVQPTLVQSDTEMQESSEEQEMELALKMSTQSTKPEQTSDLNKVMEDADFVNSVLMSLPGVKPNDDRIKNVLASIGKSNEKKESEEKDENKENK